MKRILALILTLCLLLGALPMQALAYFGDIFPAASGTVKKVPLSSGSLALQNDYLRVIVRKDGSVSTTPTAAGTDPTDRQMPFCEFITYEGYGYNIREVVHPADLRLKSVKFVNQTPNGNAKAIKAEYDLTVNFSGKVAAGTTSVYYELVQIAEDKEGTWGVLTTVDSVQLNIDWGPSMFSGDIGCRWGYTLNGFTSMGHANATDGPAIKMSRTIYNWETYKTTPAESIVLTSAVEDMSAYKTFKQGQDLCASTIHEVYTDGYTWANPFVGLSTRSDDSTIKAILPNLFSATPGSTPADTRVVCKTQAGFHFRNDEPRGISHFLWGFRDLKATATDVPTKPDEVKISISAKRLAAFASGDGVTVEYVADDAALAALKKQYGNPVAIINGDYESKNGTDFTFTGGAALLSPSVTATWGTGGKLVIHKDGRVEQNGVSLNAPSFKFYQPKNGEENGLKITLTKDGFTFGINPNKNDAIVYVDIPYAKVQLRQATADAAGNLVFTGEIGFQTIFNGLGFAMEKLGYGLNEKHEFKVNGVHATGSFDTAKLMALELAKVKGEVNTFKGEELYAFELELNAFDLFETEAKLALTRSKRDGSLIPDALWFYVKGNPGIPLIPPIPVGQLNGGGAGFKDLAKTVNGDYFAIPPLKLRGALTGTYLHLIEGTGNVVLGPSEISLTATDVGLVGVGKAGQIIEKFGYSLKLNGQERKYNGTIYNGIYFAGSEELVLNLPNKTIDVIEVKSGVELGAFGGVNDGKKEVYLGIGANGIVKGRVQIPSDVPFAGGFGADVGNINLIIGGQTTFPIKNSSVNESMKQAFNNVDIYLGAMVGVDLLIVDTRAWVLIPNIIETKFKRGGGWDIEYRWLKKLPEWDWSTKGVAIVTQEMPLEDGGEAVPVLYSAEPFALYSADVQPLVTPPPTSISITVNAGEDETPYILLAFENTVTEQQIKDNLSVTKENSNDPLRIYWVNDTEDKDKKGHIDTNYEINAAADVMNKVNGEQHRVVLLRLPTGAKGTYHISTSANGENALPFTCEQASTAPFEKLDLTQSGNTLTGKVKYPAENTSYVLRTYLGTEAGGADYLVDERDVTAPYNISFDIPTKGTLAPTGEYYVTSFLMTEKSTTFTDENGETKTVTGLVAIDNQQFDTKVSYQNTNQPKAPSSVSLEFTGNEVMRAEWQPVADADGYAVTIYQKQSDGSFKDTGFGYDVDGNTKSIDMALTVGGVGTEESPNLSANETYKVGVRAYKTIEGGKYYSAETQSDNNGVFLPKYKELDIFLAVNGVACEADDNSVYHAYVGSDASFLTVTCADANSIKVTRMDKTTNNEISEVSGAYPIPDFTGTLMLKIDGISDVANSTAKDVTSVFLLVSRDETAPVLTLSDPIFYADRNTGAYQITGTADAGSQIFYQDDEEGAKSVYAAGDGSFTISGTLEEYENNSTFALCAQDSAGNRSAFQLALVARQPEKQPDPSDSSSGGSYTPAYPVETPEQTPNGTITVSPKSASKGTTVTITVQPDPGYELGDLVVADEKGGLLKLTDKGDGKFTFTMPDGKVKLSASFRPQTPAFRDVSPSAWYAAAVNYVFAKGLMNGTGNDMFSPNADTTRGMIVTILARLDGQDTSGTPWYAAGQRWAMEHEISDGTKMTSAITREQMVTMLYRFAKAQGMDTTQGGMAIREYEDFEEISAYAVEAMTWAVNTGLIRGTGNRLLPKNTCTRAQAAMMLYRLLVTGA